MLIPFWFGLIHIGRPSGFGSYRYGAGITLCVGWRGEVPDGELPWRRIWTAKWNWMPDRIYQTIGAYAARETPAQRLISKISGKPTILADAETGVPAENLLPSEYGAATKSSRWTGRDRKLVGFGTWRCEFRFYRSRRSKMFIHLLGEKERRNPNHVVYVAPGAVAKREDSPADWFENDGVTPKQFEIKFTHGKASVYDQIGEWMIATKQAHRTNLVRHAGGALLGSLANAIAGR